MKKGLLIVLLALLVLLSAAGATARPARCVVVLDAAERDAAIASIEALRETAARIDGYMLTWDVLVESQRVIGVLEAAPSYGCAEPGAR